jgi:hypothetical protein
VLAFFAFLDLGLATHLPFFLTSPFLQDLALGFVAGFTTGAGSAGAARLPEAVSALLPGAANAGAAGAGP